MKLVPTQTRPRTRQATKTGRVPGQSVSRPAMLAVPALAALAALLGTCSAPGAEGAAQAAARAVTTSAAVAPAVTGVTWHKITLTNGWKPAAAALRTHVPAWAVSGGMVYLDGGIRQPTLGSLQFGLLPRAARPAKSLYLEILAAGANTGNGFVSIAPSGTMTVGGFDLTDARTFTSLSGISFPVAATALHKLPLINGWKSAQSVWNTGDPAYSVRGGIVHLSGGLSQPTPGNALFAVLPKAIRPATVQYLPAYTLDGVTGRVQILPNGHILSRFGQNRAITSLAGVSYLLPTTAKHELKLINGWKSDKAATGSGDPAYSLTSGVVCLSGTLHLPGGGNVVFAVVPAAIRPAYNVSINADINGAVGGFVTILHSGMSLPNGNPFSYALRMTSLSSICYPVNS